jgi:hypothetical protein
LDVDSPTRLPLAERSNGYLERVPGIGGEQAGNDQGFTAGFSLSKKRKFYAILFKTDRHGFTYAAVTTDALH